MNPDPSEFWMQDVVRAWRFSISTGISKIKSALILVWTLTPENFAPAISLSIYRIASKTLILIHPGSSERSILCFVPKCSSTSARIPACSLDYAAIFLKMALS